jgi:exodeoxyribonuclease V
MELSTDQKNTISTLLMWFKNSSKTQYITLGGYAGTGKTTVISILRKELNELNKNISVSFCSYTGKATRVLANKLKESGAIYSIDTVSTIHSLIYTAMIDDGSKEVIGWERKKTLSTNLIIVDEASMIDEQIWRDLLSYKVPIIAVGDHGQLPPINSKFNLMEKPNLKLEQIHRQAEDNPIIELSIMARTKGEIPVGKFGTNIKRFLRSDFDASDSITELLQNYKDDTVILCGFNTTRVKINKYVRSVLGFESQMPERRDRVICLKNNSKKGIFNGMLGRILYTSDIDEIILEAGIKMDFEDDEYRGNLLKQQFNSTESLTKLVKKDVDLFDFGYALTVHKSQGSQSKRVILFEERSQSMDNDTWKKWLYTGITRAEEELFIIGKQ